MGAGPGWCPTRVSTDALLTRMAEIAGRVAVGPSAARPSMVRPRSMRHQLKHSAFGDAKNGCSVSDGGTGLALLSLVGKGLTNARSASGCSSAPRR